MSFDTTTIVVALPASITFMQHYDATLRASARALVMMAQ
jgi:hypothetical protein